MQYGELIVYAVAAISGALGGCSAAAHRFISEGALRVSFILAYAVMGMVMGVLVVAYGSLAFGPINSLEEVIGHAMLAGLTGSTMLAGGHVTARWALKQFGIEVVVTARKRGEDRRDDIS